MLDGSYNNPPFAKMSNMAFCRGSPCAVNVENKYVYVFGGLSIIN